MRKGYLKTCACCVLIALLAAPSTVVAWDAYVNNVPDVDKQGVPPGPPVNGDNGCWAAAAANVLGGAGWGVGVTPQAKADSIYADLIAQFGNGVQPNPFIALGGNIEAGAKWWVHNVGLNSAMAGQGYNPTNTYINFRHIQQTLNDGHYVYLLGELNRNPSQYIGVLWNKVGCEMGHYMTLVGGNIPVPGGVNPNGDLSVWHNSDNEGPGPIDDEQYTNAWLWAGGPPATSTWFIDQPGTPENPNDDWWADAAFLACPGVPKPASAIGNFDVHCYLGVGPPGATSYASQVDLLTTGSNHGTYEAPDFNAAGEPNTYDAYWLEGEVLPTLIVPNEKVSDKFKKLYISVDFDDPVANPGQNVPDIDVFYLDDEDVEVEVLLDSSQWALDTGGAGEQVLLTYIFDEQCDWEKIVFPDNIYKTLAGSIIEWNIATECIPEPVTMVLLAMGSLVLIRRRRR